MNILKLRTETLLTTQFGALKKLTPFFNYLRPYLCFCIIGNITLWYSKEKTWQTQLL